eukprot:m.112103 g.112103  ORF g.112103 m.112103 type:complete len:384 (-) comp28169_c0_seq2:339-1490(-)
MKVVRLNQAATVVIATVVLVGIGVTLWFGFPDIISIEIEDRQHQQEQLPRSGRHVGIGNDQRDQTKQQHQHQQRQHQQQQHQLGNKALVASEQVELNNKEISTFPIVHCVTTQGNLTIEVRQDWGPIGAEKFMQMVEAGFFTHNLFYRVPHRTHPIAQFGISPSIRLRKEFETSFKDDPPTWQHLPIASGMLAFAGGGVNTRSCHFWFAIEGKSYMGHDAWETPIAHVTTGLDVLQRLTVTDGQVNINQIYNDNTFSSDFPGEYLKRKHIDWFESCSVMSDPWTSRTRYQPKPVICPSHTNCEYTGPIKAKFLPGCANECKSFSSLVDAQHACDAVESCGGMTKTAPSYFELRAGLGGVLSGRDIEESWTKSGPLVQVPLSQL